jgi:hypothetical protein
LYNIILRRLFMTGTTEGGKKAATTRGHESLRKAGEKGGKNSNQAQGAKAKGNESLSKSSQRGGAHSHRDK